ncbi:vWA domain-containing protein [Ovoidimarina sediminis]|uniref:vWA domain-containing protein n=1 Tax=Ovoidimarina sediminis TaxID=3079856 RepID=UPI002912FD92|nr:VWA domain-containing protein [Rhodophyticola sp. MJ-SS7]MDU8943678.1 VWA domain-containing protein [Rhodophyticola sp. MJ-SS7]
MSDELDRLARAMDAATPEPDAEARKAALRLAQENFDRHQETSTGARPTSERAGGARIVKGVLEMLDRIGLKGALVASTGVAVVAAVWVSQNAPLVMPGEIVVTEAVEVDRVEGAGARARDEAELTDENFARGELQTLAPTASDDDIVVEAEPVMEEAAPMQPTAKVQSAERRAIAADQSSGLAAPQSMIAPSVSDSIVIMPEADTEAYANAPENDLKIVTETPVSTFSIDVDTASYGVVRSSLNRGQLPPREAVRVEEMINYFPYTYPAPDGEHPFRPTVTVIPNPWNAGTELLHIGIQGELPAVENRPPLNLVFLIDTSGSMQDATKLPLLKQSFRMMLGELRPEDKVAIVTYAGSAGRVLDPTPAGERAVIEAALDRLEAGGSTAGQAGLQQAYATAAEMADDGEVTRVILATDGDFNVGLSDPEALQDYIADHRDSGTYLSVLGFGRGNLDDATMQALAQNGNGTAAYIDTLSEARKVLVDQLTGALFPIANDVKIQVEFNPAAVAEYRLIGYETRALRREDFNNDAVDAGEIGAGHQVTAIYEIARVGSDGVRTDPLRYGAAPDLTGRAAELGYLKMRFKAPGEDASTLIETPIPTRTNSEVNPEIAFSAAIAGFAQLLRGSAYLGDWGYDDAIALATGARGADPFGYRTEAISLMRLAETMDRR